MDTKLIDVFVSYSRADSVRVESWVKRLRKGGIEVWFDAAKENGPAKKQVPGKLAAEGCEALLWFVSKSNTISENAGHVAALASRNGKAVIVVCLDTTPAPPVFDLTLPGVSVIDLLMTGRQGTWDAILAGVRAQGIPWIPPTAKRKRSSGPNVRRSTTAAWGWLRWAMIVVGVLIAGSVAVSVMHRKPAEPVTASLPTSSSPTSPIKPLLTVTADAPSTNRSGSPVLSSTGAPPVDTGSSTAQKMAGSVPDPASDRPVPVGPTAQDLADPNKRRAIEHVTALINASVRQNGLTDAQIETISSFFANPAYFGGEGNKDLNGIRASTSIYQRKWPSFKETIHRIKVTSTTTPGVVEVIAQITCVGENEAADKPEDRHMTDAPFMHYLVDVNDLDHPKITQLWRELEKPAK